MQRYIQTALAAIMTLFLFLALSLHVSANNLDSLPEPDWTFTAPDESNLYLYPGAARFTDTSVYLFASERLYILDKKTGKQRASISHLVDSKVLFSFFGSRAEVGMDGHVYILTTHENASGALKERLTAYSANGAKLWVKNYDEKVRSNAGVTLLSDGTVLVYLETASEQQTTYRYDSQGKLLGKQQWSGATYGFSNGYLPLYNWTGKASSRVTFYNSSLVKQFSYDIKFEEGMFLGLAPDGYLYRQLADSAPGTDRLAMFDTRGKLIWNKNLTGNLFILDFKEQMVVGKRGFSAGLVGILGYKELFWIDNQGRMHKASADAPTYYQTAYDNTIMLMEKSKLSIYEAVGSTSPYLKRLHTLSTANLNNKENFLYEGEGIVYYGDKNKLQRLNLAHPPVRVYINGEKASLGASPQAINGTLMVPLRGTVEALGGSIKRLNATVTVTVGDNKVMMTVGKKTAMVNGNPQQLAAAPVERGGHTLVPLRFLSEALGAKVKWDQAAGTVHIDLS